MEKLLMVKEAEGQAKYFVREEDIFEGYFLENDIFVFSLIDEDEEIKLQEKYEGDIVEFAEDNTIIGNYLCKGISDSEKVEDYFDNENYGLIEETKEGIDDLEEYFNGLDKINYICNKNEDVIIDDMIAEEPIELNIMGYSKILKLSNSCILNAEESNYWVLLEDRAADDYLIIKAPAKIIDDKIKLDWDKLKEIHYFELIYNELDTYELGTDTDNIYFILDDEYIAKSKLGINVEE